MLAVLGWHCPARALTPSSRVINQLTTGHLPDELIQTDSTNAFPSSKTQDESSRDSLLYRIFYHSRASPNYVSTTIVISAVPAFIFRARTMQLTPLRAIHLEARLAVGTPSGFGTIDQSALKPILLVLDSSLEHILTTHIHNYSLQHKVSPSCITTLSPHQTSGTKGPNSGGVPGRSQNANR